MKRLLLGSFLPVVLALSFPTRTAHAFKPRQTFGHTGIVSEVLTPYSVTGSDGAQLMFTADAREEVGKAVADVDLLDPAEDGEFFSADAHCDDELLMACSKRVVAMREDVVRALSGARPNGATARKAFGRGLHTLQDFYAHSNWIHLAESVGASKINPVMGFSAFSADPSRTSRMCVNWDSNTYVASGLTEITTGYFSYYSTDPADPDKWEWRSRSIPDWKCDHGGTPAFIGIPVATGINKDSPLEAGHVEARRLAVDATRAYLESILQTPGIQGNDAAIKAFFGIQSGRMIGFVIDTTSSMQPIINGVKTAVTNIINRALGASMADTNEFLLVSFGDPSVSAVTVTPDSMELLQKVSALRAGVPENGGDCPEVSMAGLRAAIGAASEGATLYLFTDASSTDGTSIGPNVLAEATAKNIRVNPMISGSCSPIDPIYIRLAAETGGQLIEHERTEAATANVFTALNDTSTSLLRSILSVEDTLSAPTASQTFLVDSTLSNLLVAVNQGTKGTIHLITPAGIELLAGDANVAISETLNGRIYNLIAPQAGTWTVRLEGTTSDTFSISARGESAIGIARVSFVELQGRPEHQGLFDIVGQPLLGSKQTLESRIEGDAVTLRFELRSPAGAPLSTVELAPLGLPEEKIFQGELMLPAVPFRLYALGRTPAGDDLQRVYPAIFKGQSLRVSPLPGALEIVPGHPFVARFAVTNFGTARSFNITASDTLKSVARITPQRLDLATGQTAEVEVLLQVPTTAAAGTVVTISIVASSSSSSSSGDERENGSVTARVVGLDTDGDGVSDRMEQGRLHDDPSFDGNADGRPDFQQPEVASMFASTLAAYVTFSTAVPSRFANFGVSSPAAVPALPGERSFVLGKFDFELDDVTRGASSEVVLKIHGDLPWTLDRVDALTATPSWLDFAAAFGAPVVVGPQSLRLPIRDGALGDLGRTTDGKVRVSLLPSQFRLEEGEGVAPFSGEVMPDDGASCGCRIPGAPARTGRSPGAWLAGFTLLLLVARRARRRRCDQGSCSTAGRGPK